MTDFSNLKLRIPLRTRIWYTIKQAVRGVILAGIFAGAVGVIVLAGMVLIESDHKRQIIRMQAQAELDVFVTERSYLERGSAFMRVCKQAEAPAQACILAFGRGGVR